MDKPLQNYIKDILNHISQNTKEFTMVNQKIIDICDGQLLKLIEDDLQAEMLSRAYNQIKTRIFPLNILPRYVDKVSRCYALEPLRRATEESEQELVDSLANYLNINETLQKADEYLTKNKSVLLEPYCYKGKLKIRVIPASQFMVWTDSVQEPNEPEVIIKYVGQVKSNPSLMDSQGIKNTSYGNETREVALFYFYTETEFLIVDQQGTIRSDLMEGMSGENPYGFIPLVYIRWDDSQLINLPDSDMIPVTINIAKIISDLNYAVKYQSHSITYGIDVEFGDPDSNPDQIWDLKSVQGDNSKPQVGIIKPEVDVDKVLNLVTFQLSSWLETKGVKAGSVGTPTQSNIASGIAKIIDEADTSNLIKKHILIWKRAEQELWVKLAFLFNIWKSNGSLILPTSFPTEAFSEQFDISIDFEEATAIKTDEQLLKEIEQELKLGLTSKKEAIKKYRPGLSDEDVDALLLEIQEEKVTSMENNQEAINGQSGEVQPRENTSSSSEANNNEDEGNNQTSGD